MKSHELEDMLKKRSDNGEFQPSAMIEYDGEKGVVLMLGESLATGTWLSGDIIVHWEKGEHTILPEEFNLIHENLWSLK